LMLRGAKGNITQRNIFNPPCSESKHSEQLSEKKMKSFYSAEISIMSVKYSGTPMHPVSKMTG
ncbi:MAG: hypothetical protein WCC49_11695, partial [Pantoea agglomerans]